MIEFRFPEEKEISLYYANLMNDDSVIEILEKGFVKDSKEALKLKDFYWNMVDLAAKDQGKGSNIAALLNEGVEAWMEYIFHTINGYMVSSGYENEWDEE